MADGAIIVTPHLRAEAADWHARVSGDAMSPADWEAFTQWLERGAAEVAAFDDLDALYHVAGLTGVREAPMADVISLAEVRARKRADEPDRAPPRRKWLVGSLAAAAAAAAALLVLGVRTRSPDVRPDSYSTAVGQIRELALSDGTHVHLGPASVLAVDLSGASRHAALAQGEAFFDVAHDADRPFTIDVADRQVRVLGTAFNVMRETSGVTVEVMRGTVAVGSQQDIADNAAPKLTRGMKLRHQFGSNETTVSKISPDSIAAWRQGRRHYHDAPLDQVVADMARYFSKPVRLESDALGKLPFTGILVMDSADAVAHRLEAFLPVTAVVGSKDILLRRK